MSEERKLKKVSSDVVLFELVFSKVMLSTVQFAMFELPLFNPSAAHILP